MKRWSKRILFAAVLPYLALMVAAAIAGLWYGWKEGYPGVR